MIKRSTVTSSPIVVTGAAGFIGSHVVDRLLNLGHHVIGIDRRQPQVDPFARVNMQAAMDHSRFTLIEADLLSGDLAQILDGAGCVFHLAAVPGVRASWGSGFDEYLTANVLATQRLLTACERTGVPRLVYASSSSVYGPAGGPSRECDPTRPLSPYGVTKLAGEQLCLAHALRPGASLRTIALRYFTVYGPRQRPDMAIGRILASALTGSPYVLFGDGSQRREFTYIDDVVAATIAAAGATANATVINIGGGCSVDMCAVIATAEDVTRTRVPVTQVAVQAGDVPATAADLTTARTVLGYRPSVDLRTGMARHTEWLRWLPPGLLGAYVRPSAPVGQEVAACSS
ncbi:MAG: NAD-dependent epimerase/dehydratase family protein [Micromonosporaceae bacterium]|nr:NAD-dependent epimerase/dehydratase family protein [Micromonosporaceae bacterium]